ncbi:MAG: ABC transporter ATP-binding protein [Chloroflexota bacterium]
MALWFKTSPQTHPADASGEHPLIRLRGVQKHYRTSAGDVQVLKGIDLDIRRGEFVAIAGKSGSGKTTLLNMITGIDRPTRGEVWVQETGIHQLSEAKMARWRGRNLGIVFQFFQLLPMLTLLDNVMLPMDFCHLYTPRQRRQRACDLLEMVGLKDHSHKLPAAVSGGQQQRAAIARALANDPPLIIADEPTGNLDSKTAETMMEVFQTLVARGKTFVIVTHDNGLAERVHRTTRIADGEIVSDENHIFMRMPDPQPVLAEVAV